MPDLTTPRVGLVLPTVGMDRDTWGNITNGNWNLLDTLIGGVRDSAASSAALIDAVRNSIINYVEPVGTVKMWPTPNPPPGWFPCDGWEISRTDYPDLFAAIGGYWGTGNGSTTFNIPNLQGMVIAHRGGWIGWGARVGEITHTLVPVEMPSHRHGGDTEPVGDHSHGYARPSTDNTSVAGGGGPLPAGAVGAGTDPAGGHSHPFATGYAGNDQPHNNVQPTVAMLAIIKAVHVGF